MNNNSPKKDIFLFRTHLSHLVFVCKLSCFSPKSCIQHWLPEFFAASNEGNLNIDFSNISPLNVILVSLAIKLISFGTNGTDVSGV